MNRNLDDYLSALKTSRQLHLMGYSNRKISSLAAQGKIGRIHRGVYCRTDFLNTLHPWEEQFLRVAGYFIRHPETVFSHTSAAQIMGLPVPSQQPVHIYAGTNSKSTVPGVKKHILLTPDTATVTHSGEVITTSALQTVADSVRILPTGDALALADAALFRGTVDVRSLREKLLGSRGRCCRKMRWVAEHMSPLAESVGESYTRLRLIEMGLRFREQVNIHVDGCLYRSDFALEGLPLLVEFDGRMKLTDFGASDTILARERQREKALQNQGWFLFRVGWQHVVHEPQVFIRDLNRLVRAVAGHRVPGFRPSS